MERISRHEYARRVMSNPTDYYIWTRHLANRVSREGLSIRYFADTDTLFFHIAESTGFGETVAPGLCVNFDPEGWAMGVVIERAAELLRPYLLAESAGVA